MAFATSKAPRPKRYVVIEHYIITDFRSFADHHPNPMINEESTTYLCAGMYFNTSSTSRAIRKDSRD